MGESGPFSSQFRITDPHWGKSGQELKQARDLEAGTEAREREVLLPGLLNLLSYSTEDHQPRAGTTQNPHITIKKMHTSLLTCQPYEGILSIESIS